MRPRWERSAIAGATVGVAALIGAMVADLAETIVDPANSGQATQFYSAAAQHHVRIVASAVLLLASGLLLVPGVFAVARSLPRRGRWVGLAAGLVALLGSAGHIGLATFYLAFATIPDSGLSRADGVALIDHVTASHEALVIAPLVIAFPLAILLTLIAAVRGRLVGRLLLVPVLAAPVVAIAGPGSDAAKTSVALALFLVAAIAVLRASRKPHLLPEPATA